MIGSSIKWEIGARLLVHTPIDIKIARFNPAVFHMVEYYVELAGIFGVEERIRVRGGRLLKANPFLAGVPAWSCTLLAKKVGGDQ